MPEHKHTPGPWVARRVGGAGFPGQIGWAIDYNAAQEQVVDFVYEEADARLIAASPDLLEALQDLVREVAQCDTSLFDHELRAARAAIAKATGQA